MQGVPADREEQEGTLQKVRERHAWAIPGGASPKAADVWHLPVTSEGTCAAIGGKARYHQTGNKQSSEAGAKWGPGGLPGVPGGPVRGGVCEGVLGGLCRALPPGEVIGG